MSFFTPVLRRTLLLFGFIVAVSSGPAMADTQTKANETAETRARINAERQFQHDADLARLEHLAYWSGLIEEYNTKTGHYPFQDRLTFKDKPGLVRIETREQMQYFTPGSPKYNPKIDNNADGHFQEFSIKSFVTELEAKLGRPIDEKYDIQRAPVRSPIGYNYFVTRNGYLLWTPCISCGVTPISTLLMDGYTPTVNIASPSMGDKATKAMTRPDMLNDPIFKKWLASKYVKESFVRKVEQENLHDSRKPDAPL